MPRKPRIDIPGYYHIINRGAERRVVYGEAEDYRQSTGIESGDGTADHCQNEE